MTEAEKLRPHIEKVDPQTLTLLELNARYMRKEEFDRLVANLRTDGCLTSVPLVWDDPSTGQRVVLSGNHRVQASIVAELPTIDVMVIDQPLHRQRRIGLQLSHNSIAGEDDPATLRQLYEELDDVDWRGYSGLDDAQLKLLAEVSTEGLSEANLDFATVQLMFLPAELDAAKKALELGKAGAQETWIAALSQYETTLQALDSVHTSHKIGNVATALHIILSVFERHLTDLQEGYQDGDGEPIHKNPVGLETVFGTRLVPTSTATLVNRAIQRAVKVGDIERGEGWRLLEQLAAAYLSGLDADRAARSDQGGTS